MTPDDALGVEHRFGCRLPAALKTYFFAVGALHESGEESPDLFEAFAGYLYPFPRRPDGALSVPPPLRQWGNDAGSWILFRKDLGLHDPPIRFCRDGTESDAAAWGPAIPLSDFLLANIADLLRQSRSYPLRADSELALRNWIASIDSNPVIVQDGSDWFTQVAFDATVCIVSLLPSVALESELRTAASPGSAGAHWALFPHRVAYGDWRWKLRRYPDGVSLGSPSFQWHNPLHHRKNRMSLELFHRFIDHWLPALPQNSALPESEVLALEEQAQRRLPALLRDYYLRAGALHREGDLHDSLETFAGYPVPLGPPDPAFFRVEDDEDEDDDGEESWNEEDARYYGFMPSDGGVWAVRFDDFEEQDPALFFGRDEDLLYEGEAKWTPVPSTLSNFLTLNLMDIICHKVGYHLEASSKEAIEDLMVAVQQPPICLPDSVVDEVRGFFTEELCLLVPYWEGAVAYPPGVMGHIPRIAFRTKRDEDAWRPKLEAMGLMLSREV